MESVQVAQPSNRLIGWFHRTARLPRRVRDELKKVTWPTRDELIKATRMISCSRFFWHHDRPARLGAPADPGGWRRAARALGDMEYRWYAIQTTAGHENKVRRLLQRRIEDDPRPAEEKLIRQALVPVQEVIEIKNGKKVNVERKLYPGYVLVEMGMSQEALHVVNSIQGVIKFVGTGRCRSRSGRTRSTACWASPRRWPRRSRRRRSRSWSARWSRSPRGRSPTSAAPSKRCWRQGQGPGVGQPVRPAHGSGAGLPAAPGALRR